MIARNPIRDQVAIVGLGTTGFARDSGGRSSKSLACEAAIAAIRDAGLEAQDIDGVVGPLEPAGPHPNEMAAALGISEVTHFSSPMPVAMFALFMLEPLYYGAWFNSHEFMRYPQLMDHFNVPAESLAFSDIPVVEYLTFMSVMRGAEVQLFVQ